MRFIIGLVAMLPLAVVAATPDAPDGVASDEISMQAPTENTDGTPLTDLSHLDLKWGFTAGDYSAGSQRIEAVTEGETLMEPVTITLTGSHGDEVTVYFVGTATDEAGNESANSNEISKTYRIVDTTVPNPPSIQFVVPIAVRAISPDGQLLNVIEVAQR